MGWDYLTVARPTNAKEFLDKEFAEGLVASAMHGRNEYYAAYRAKNGDVFGMVVILDRKKGEFGWKSMDESMGPHYHNCPAKILDLLTAPTNEYALKWRNQCRANLLQKKSAKTVRNGDVVQFKDVLHFGPYGTEQTFTVCKVGKTVRFQMEKNGLLCRITKWQSRPFTILHEAPR